MKPLESRKQLLLAESEINRAQLVGTVVTLKAEARAATARFRSVGSVVAVTGSLFAGMQAFRRGEPSPPAAKRSWFKTFLEIIGPASLIWRTFRSHQARRDKG